MLSDNGTVFTKRFIKPRPAAVLFERICRENGVTQRLTKPASPTTTGKIERLQRPAAPRHARALADHAPPEMMRPPLTPEVRRTGIPGEGVAHASRRRSSRAPIAISAAV